MSRNAAATTAGRARTIRRTPAPPLPRRVSGPAAANRRDASAAPARPHVEPSARASRALIEPRALAFAEGAVAPRRGMLPAALPRPRTFPAPQPRRLAYGGVALASRVAGVAIDVSTSRLMDRLVRSRVWIGVIAFGLIGIVAMQVSLLKLNAGIGRAVQTASTLERSNAGLRGDISRLSAGDRIQGLAEAEGLVMPAPADVGYLHAGDPRAAAARAAQRMRAPNPAVAGLAGAVMSPDLDAGVTPAPGGAANTSAVGATGPSIAGSGPAVTGAGAGVPGTAAGSGTTAPGTAAPGTAAPGSAAAATAPATTAGSGTAVPGGATTAGTTAPATATIAGTNGAAATQATPAASGPAAATGATAGPSGGRLPGRATAP